MPTGGKNGVTLSHMEYPVVGLWKAVLTNACGNLKARLAR
jgi:hypothetical protein